MIPVLVSVAGISITSFGFFLTLAILLALYTSWRLARVYEIDLEKFLDIFFLTLIVGVVFSRLYFVIFHLNLFDDPLKILLINRYPGFSFWGALIGGGLSLRFFARGFKLNFWQLLDFATVALFLAVAIADLGCLLGSCRYGVESNLPLSVVQSGVLGTRFPVQLVESVLFLACFGSLWRGTLRFHLDGTIFAKGLLFLGILGIALEGLRGDPEILTFLPVNLRLVWSTAAFLLGAIIFYRQNKRSFRRDLKLGFGFFLSSKSRNYIIFKLSRSCYNQFIKFKLEVRGFRKKFFKNLNVKSNPNNF